MSQENVEIVRAAFEAAGREPTPDFETLNRLYRPDHRMTSDYGVLGGESYVGAKGFQRALTDFDTDWETWRQELDEFLDAGEDAVVVLGHLVARGKSSGVPVDASWAALVRLREGQIAETRFFLDREAALEAAGLDE